MSYILLVISMIYFIVSYKGLKKIYPEQNIKELLIILIIILGYFTLHWLTHAYSRYSLPVLPFLFIWGGVYLEKLLFKTTKTYN